MSPTSLGWRDLVLLGLAALTARLGASFLVADPPYLDAAYYELVARRLAEGHGFSAPVLWSFLEVGGVLPADPALPVPSNRHWMPLTSILSAGSMAILGASRFAAELPHILLGTVLAPLTAWIGWSLWRSRTVALVGGGLAIFAGPMLVYVPLVDGFALFGVTGALAILFSIHAARPGAGGAWLIASGVAAALATLTRIDGVLLGVAPSVAWLARRGVGPWRVAGPPISAWWAIGGILAGVTVMAPWLARQAAEFGAMLPSAGGRLLWITSYNEQFSITGDPTIESYLAAGLPTIIGGKIDAAWVLLGRTTVLLGGALVVPFFYGLWRERGRAELAPFGTYWVAQFAVMALIFTVHAPFGAYYHSAWAWLPFALPMALANGGPLLGALGRRVRLFGRERNARLLGVAVITGAVVLSLVGSGALIAIWAREQVAEQAAAKFLVDSAAPHDVVMYVDPPSLHLRVGNRVVAPPYDPPEVIGQVASAYDVAWVVVEKPSEATSDVLGLWDGASWLDEQPSFDEGNVRIYAVRR